ncbi:MAG: rhomboid family intramembrane serine protease [Lachnospiraceae bacterium]|nr:rhomboid family intramembrane serine protease [Lachnospiraceae bacterium]
MKKKLKLTFNAPVVLGIVGVSLIATILNFVTAGGSNLLLFSTYRASMLSPFTWLRAFTHIFGHADMAHFAGNMSYLLLLGPMLEEKYGSGTLGFAVVVTAFVTSLVNFIFFPGIALCGASGVVFTFIMLSSFTSFREGEIPLTFILVMVFYIGQQVIDGLTIRDNISNMAHILGGIVGGVLGYALNVRKDRLVE